MRLPDDLREASRPHPYCQWRARAWYRIFIVPGGVIGGIEIE
jgi:hypothetical protein